MPLYILQGKPIKGKNVTMGMSATQANLLCLTSRLHDVENKAQFIESEKIALATQQDAIYQTYCAALDATKIQVAFNNVGDGKRYFVDATFENVCTYDPTRCKQYSLTDAKTGKLFVTPEMKEAYETFKDDKYNFAWYMLMTEGKCSQGSWNGAWDQEKISIAGDGVSLTQVEELVLRRHAEGTCCYEEDIYDSNGQLAYKKGDIAYANANKGLNTLYENYYNTYMDENATTEDKLKALYDLREALYTSYGNEIYNLMQIDKQAAVFPGFADGTEVENDNWYQTYPNDVFEYKTNVYEFDEDYTDSNGNTHQKGSFSTIKYNDASQTLHEKGDFTITSNEYTKAEPVHKAGEKTINWYREWAKKYNAGEECIEDIYDKNGIKIYSAGETLDKDLKEIYDKSGKLITENNGGKKIYSFVDFKQWYEDETKKNDSTSSSYLDIDKEIGDDSFPRAEFNYYVNLWQSITNAGGCTEVPVAAEAGDESNKWFNDMVKSGRAIINVYNENTKEWGETNVATSVNVNFLQENQDETDLKKAEAEYEYQLSVIEKKDTEFDRELSKLETERSSIKQIMESIKTVKDENIDRTFNIFS